MRELGANKGGAWKEARVYLRVVSRAARANVIHFVWASGAYIDMAHGVPLSSENCADHTGDLFA